MAELNKDATGSREDFETAAAALTCTDRTDGRGADVPQRTERGFEVLPDDEFEKRFGGKDHRSVIFIPPAQFVRAGGVSDPVGFSGGYTDVRRGEIFVKSSALDNAAEAIALVAHQRSRIATAGNVAPALVAYEAALKKQSKGLPLLRSIRRFWRDDGVPAAREAYRRALVEAEITAVLDARAKLRELGLDCSAGSASNPGEATDQCADLSRLQVREMLSRHPDYRELLEGEWRPVDVVPVRRQEAAAPPWATTGPPDCGTRACGIGVSSDTRPSFRTNDQDSADTKRDDHDAPGGGDLGVGGISPAPPPPDVLSPVLPVAAMNPAATHVSPPVSERGPTSRVAELPIAQLPVAQEQSAAAELAWPYASEHFLQSTGSVVIPGLAVEDNPREAPRPFLPDPLPQPAALLIPAADPRQLQRGQHRTRIDEPDPDMNTLFPTEVATDTPDTQAEDADVNTESEDFRDQGTSSPDQSLEEIQTWQAAVAARAITETDALAVANRRTDRPRDKFEDECGTYPGRPDWEGSGCDQRLEREEAERQAAAAAEEERRQQTAAPPAHTHTGPLLSAGGGGGGGGGHTHPAPAPSGGGDYVAPEPTQSYPAPAQAPCVEWESGHTEGACGTGTTAPSPGKSDAELARLV